MANSTDLLSVPQSTVPAAARMPARARLAVSGLFLLSGLVGASWVSRIPEVQLQRGLSNGLLGLSLLSATVGAVLTMPLAGVAVARVGSARVVKVAALALCALVTVLFSPSPLPIFLLSLFAFGAAGGTLGVAMNAQAVLVERAYARPIMSSFHAVFSAGGLLGAALGGFLTAAQVAPRLHLSLVGLSAAVAIFLAFSELPAGEVAAPRQHESRRARGPNRRLIALGVLALCAMLGEGAVADWSGVYLRSEIHASAGLAAGGFAAFSIAMAVGRWAGDWLSARWGSVALLRVSGAVSAVGLLIALGWQSVPGALFGFAAVGAGLAVVIPTLFSSAGRLPEVSPAYALASVTTLGYAGFLAGPPAIGFASEAIGLRAALGIVVCTSLLIVVLAPVARGHQSATTPVL